MSDYNRKTSKIDLGEGLYRYKVRYETPECQPHDQAGLFLQSSLLKAITDSPELLRCGNGKFKELKMFHDGMRWVIELQRDENEG